MKLDRLLGILTILLQKQRVTAPYLAQRFEVSRRTITRDIDALCMAGIPVVTMQGAGGGITIAEGYKLDKGVLTYDELSDIIASLKGLGSVSGGSQMERTLEKLSISKENAMVSLRESIIIDLASNAKTSLTEKVGLLKRAIQESLRITFAYFYEKGEVKREIEPYLVLFIWSAWYVLGYCIDRDDWRLFKLSRLWSLQVTVDHFTPRDIPQEQMDFGSRLTDEKTLIALFDPSEKYQLVDSYGPNCYTVMPDGMLRLELGYKNDSFILRWLLGFGSKVRVLAPDALVAIMRGEAEEMCARYR